MKILTTGWPQGPELGPRADQLALLKLGWEPREGDATWVCVHTLGWSPAYVYRYAGLEAYAIWFRWPPQGVSQRPRRLTDSLRAGRFELSEVAPRTVLPHSVAERGLRTSAVVRGLAARGLLR